MFYIKNITFLFAILLFAVACEPVQDPEIDLPEVPTTASFTAEPSADNPNVIVIQDNSVGFFDRLWDLPGGTPSSSKESVDSILFISAGEYVINLHVSGEGGGGSALVTKTIIIDEDAEVECDEQVALLTGDCSAAGKCWVFSTVAGAVTVGPTAGSGEWFTSQEAGLVPEQYDDQACFIIEGLTYDYRNNGQTVNPWEGFEAQDFTPPPGQTWSFSPSGGTDGLPQINLSPDGFMGVRDSGPFYDVVTLTETELVVRSRFRNADGTTPDEGWFELYFVAE
jgi:PKD repeat protein